MDILKWKEYRESLPSMAPEDLFIKYSTSQGARDKAYLWEQIKRYHNLNDETKSKESLEFAKSSCAKFVEIAVNHPALYDFVLDTDTDEYWNIIDPDHKVENRCRLASDFFIPWIAVEVPRSIALEVVYGYGLDLYGNYREIPKTDPFFYFTYKNDLFAAIAERGIRTTELLRKLNPEKILFLAAGMAPEFRHLGFELSENQSAILVDNDQTINSVELLQDVPRRENITYLCEDIMSSIIRPELRGQDAIVANGIICYVWEKFPFILRIIYDMLESGGNFIFEIYPKHWEWERNRIIKGYYLPLKLFDNCDQAESAVIDLAAEVGFSKITSHRYYDDFQREIMIVFNLKKP